MKQYILSSDPLFERCYSRPADKRRKLSNGMIKCELHMYYKHSMHSSAKKRENGSKVIHKKFINFMSVFPKKLLHNEKS